MKTICYFGLSEYNGCAVSSYGLEEEATEYVNSAHIDEEDDTVDKYSLPDQQHQQEGDESVPEIVVEETPVEEEFSATHQHMNAEAEPLPAPVEEPTAEPPKQTYASIVIFIIPKLLITC